MNTFNAISSAVFDVLLAPLGHGPAWLDLLLWPVLCGILALLVYKRVSNQAGIERVKAQIQALLYEIRMFAHDPLVVVVATAKITAKNAVYIGYNLVPMLVLLVPMLAVLVQLEANYAFAPAPVGSVELLEVRLDPDQLEVRAADVTLELPPGVVLDAPPVRTADGEVFWRLRAEQAGDHALKLTAGRHELVKGWAVGGEPRKVPVKRTADWEAFLYPGEAGIPAGSVFTLAELRYPERDLGWLPGGEAGVLGLFFGLSLVAGFALKDVFGVTL